MYVCNLCLGHSGIIYWSHKYVSNTPASVWMYLDRTWPKWLNQHVFAHTHKTRFTTWDDQPWCSLFSRAIFKIFENYIYYIYIFSLSIYNSLSQCQAPSLIATVPCLCQLSTTPSDGLLHGTLGRVSIGHTASIRAAMQPIWIAELQVFHQILDLLWLAKEKQLQIGGETPKHLWNRKG